MKKFAGTRIIAGIFIAMGAISALFGFVMVISPEQSHVLGITFIVSGLMTVLLAQVVMVLLAIEENTRPPESKASESAPDVLTM